MHGPGVKRENLNWKGKSKGSNPKKLGERGDPGRPEPVWSGSGRGGDLYSGGTGQKIGRRSVGKKKKCAH